MRSLTDDELRRARLGAQLLDPDSAAADPAAIVQRLVVVQAQDRLAATLGLRVRGRGFTAADAEARRVASRELVRTWLHRATIQLLCAADLPWLLPLLGPPTIRAVGARWARLGVDGPDWERLRLELRAALADGPRSRRVLAERFPEDKAVTGGQRLPHILLRAALEGWVCDGPDEGRDRTWVLLDDWLPGFAPDPSAEQAGPELLRRYLAGHGPAGPKDFASWSGLPMAPVRAAFAALGAQIEEVAWRGQVLACLRAGEGTSGPSGGDVVRLAPGFDAYLLGYQSPRPHALEDADVAAVVVAGGLIKPILLRAGRVAGTWWPRQDGGRVSVEVAPFGRLGRGRWEAEVSDIHRYLGGGADGVTPAA